MWGATLAGERGRAGSGQDGTGSGDSRGIIAGPVSWPRGKGLMQSLCFGTAAPLETFGSMCILGSHLIQTTKKREENPFLVGTFICSRPNRSLRAAWVKGGRQDTVCSPYKFYGWSSTIMV